MTGVQTCALPIYLGRVLARVADHAEVIVIGNACEDATEVLAAAQPEHLTIDLTRGHATRSVGRGGAGS